jgi:predicted Holliday junction resolvase-like endonuclease
VAIGLGILIVILVLAACLWLVYDTRNQVKMLRGELDQTQRQLNDLKAAAEVVPTVPPPLPKSRARGGLEDLREQLRASHREESSSEPEP